MKRRPSLMTHHPYNIQVTLSIEGVAYISEMCLMPDLNCTVTMQMQGSAPLLNAGDRIGLTVQHECPAPLRFEWTLLMLTNGQERCYASGFSPVVVPAGGIRSIGDIVVNETGRYLSRVMIGPRKVELLEHLAMLVDEHDETG